tara:strand:- start:2983 stop:3528 length:546 start_codon:yes stop_codon:yes gene_type:complete
MNKTIPAFLIEMSKQMHEQDNRITAEPIWQVRYKQYLVTECGYNEHHWEIFDTDGCTVLFTSQNSECSTLAEHIRESDPDWIRDFMVDFDQESFEDALYREINSRWFDFDDLPDGLVQFYMQEIEVIAKTCLTEADANWFIKRKQHDYPKLYTYVESMVFCPQMIELRNWIMSLTTAEVKA